MLFGRLPISAACLHAEVPPFDSLGASAFSGELGTPYKGTSFSTQAWQKSPFTRRDGVRPSQKLDGVTKRYSLFIAFAI
jgi:hypothetical protein